jgi:hypothetical protein
MLGRAEVERLQKEKAALVLESSLNRLRLKTELRELRASTDLVSRMFGQSGPILGSMRWLAPVAGFFLARKAASGSGGWFNRLVSAAGLIGPLTKLWQQFASKEARPAGAEAETPETETPGPAASQKT